MFYRFTKNNLRLPLDLDDMFQDEACFIAGGAPSLSGFAELLERPYPHIVAINNAATVVPASLWVGGDKPDCYSRSILCDPTIPKFTMISRREYGVEGRPWREWPNTFFFGTKDGFNVRNFLERHRDLCWWKNTFFIALQLAYRLGFRKAYLVGCEFDIDEGHQYAWQTKLDEDEVKWNQRLYDNSVRRIGELMPLFKKKGFEVVSCTPDSQANGVLPYREAEEVLAEFRARIPAKETLSLPHSSKVTAAQASVGADR